jgi:hypothetical protein
MPREVQQDVARQIKEAAEKGVRICTASVPHRSDDVVRSNPELRGRVQAIDFEYWTNDETREIADLGFSALNISVDHEIVERFAKDCFGSPQLMQSVCLQFCREVGVEETRDRTLTPLVDDNVLRRVLQNTSTMTDFSSLLDALHSGPKPRGQERNRHDFFDNSNGDVYRCVLLALRSDPPLLSFPYDEIYRRTREVCLSRASAPPGSGVSQALEQMHSIAESLEPSSKIIEWSEDVLDIADPYFLFYLRCSNRLEKIQRKRPTE